MGFSTSFVHSLLRRATDVFFRHFFRFLLAFVSIAEWACVAWFIPAGDQRLPARAHVTAVLIVYLANFVILRRIRHSSPPGWRRVALRAYTAFVFTTVFGFAFILLNSAAWTALDFLTQGVSIAAGERTAAAVAWPRTGYEWSTTAGLAGIGLLFLWGYTAGQYALAVSRYRIPLARGSASLAGLRVVHVSDIHIGRYMEPDALAHYVERVNALEPDILAITGDIIDHCSALEEGFPILARLRARHGVFAVLGNHDFYAGADAVGEGLRRFTDFTLLRDDVATVTIGDARLHIAGVDDLGLDWARGVPSHPGLTRMLPKLAGSAPVILLSHRPDLFPQAAAAGIELVLSGHTHGGQLSLPALGDRPLTLARFITQYDRGLYADGASRLYVNCGIGCTGQRIRLFTPREITVFELAVS